MSQGKSSRRAGQRKTRRRICRVLATVILLSCLFETAACQKEEGAKTESAAEVTETSVLRVSMLVPVDAQPDLELVEKEVNKITERQLGAKIELVPVRTTNFSDIYIQMMAEGEGLDLMLLPSGTNYLPGYVENDFIMPLDEYIDGSAGFLSAIMKTGLQAGKYQELQYGIPQETTRVSAYAKGFNLSRKLCDRYGIDTASIHTVEDLETVFELIQEKEPSVLVLMPENPLLGIADCLTPFYDELTTGPGVLIEEDGDCRVGDILEQEPMQKALQTVRAWYEKGFIPQNVAITDEFGSDMLKVGECFATASDMIGPEMGGTDYYSIILNQELPLMTTNLEASYLWVVSSGCKNPSLALSFLNLCYRDSILANLLHYGINGVHYQMMENGTLDTSKNAGYSNSLVQFGKISEICFDVATLQAADYAQGIKTAEKLKILYLEWETRDSIAYGFFFDPEAVSLEISACSQIDEKYELLLKNGVIDPDTELAVYIRELESAGRKKIMEEKERQLQEWLLEKKKIGK